MASRVFLPKSVLNSFRRDALEFLTQKIIEQNEKDICAKVDEKKIKTYQNLGEVANFDLPFSNILVVNEENMQYVSENKNTLFILSPQQYSNQIVQKFNKKF